MNLTPEQILTAKPMPMFIHNLRDAIRDGKKTQTRRVVSNLGPNIRLVELLPGHAVFTNERHEFLMFPKYRIGDMCYLREPLKEGIDQNGFGFVMFADDGAPPNRAIPWHWKSQSLSQMLMPRCAARTFCEITSVRVERVQDISEEDAKAEGVKDSTPSTIIGGVYDKPLAVEKFITLWDSINAKRGHAYATNPWVWVYEFRLLK